jgi:hypothetical protein
MRGREGERERGREGEGEGGAGEAGEAEKKINFCLLNS